METTTKICLYCGNGGHFKKGHVPHNKGKTFEELYTTEKSNRIRQTMSNAAIRQLSRYTAPMKTQEQFVKDIARLHPTLKVLSEYKGKLCPILVRDDLGIDYKIRPVNLMIGYFPSVAYSAVNKTDAFKKKVAVVLPSVKVKGKYIDIGNKVLIEDENGIEYLSLPRTLLRGSPPTIQSAVNKNKAFEIKARKIHGDKYDYSKVEYIKCGIKVKIGCPIHGFFMQDPGAHLCTCSGCRKCGNEIQGTKARYNIFSRSNWIKYCIEMKKIPYVYIIKCYDEQEEFIKIGITGNKLKDRLCPSSLPYKYKEIGRIIGEPAFVFDMEKTLHDKYEEYKYIPLKKFGGFLECFTVEVLNKIYWKQLKIAV